MKEAELQKAVIAMAQLFGWRVAHFPTGKTHRGTWATSVQGDARGFPDLVLVKGERVIFAELKMDGKYLKPEQRVWIEALAKTPAETYVWKPATYLAGEIERTLA